MKSPKVATYDLQPEMSAPEVCEKLCAAIRSEKYDVIVINFANPDMVGHTGIIPAAIKAIETVDTCVGKAVEALKEVDGQMFICADHGNAEQMVDYETGAPFTAHTDVYKRQTQTSASRDYVLFSSGKSATRKFLNCLMICGHSPWSAPNLERHGSSKMQTFGWLEIPHFLNRISICIST